MNNIERSGLFNFTITSLRLWNTSEWKDLKVLSFKEAQETLRQFNPSLTGKEEFILVTNRQFQASHSGFWLMTGSELDFLSDWFGEKATILEKNEGDLSLRFETKSGTYTFQYYEMYRINKNKPNEYIFMYRKEIGDSFMVSSNEPIIPTQTRSKGILKRILPSWILRLVFYLQKTSLLSSGCVSKKA